MWLSGVCGPHVPVCIPKEIWAYSLGECALGGSAVKRTGSPSSGVLSYECEWSSMVLGYD